MRGALAQSVIGICTFAKSSSPRNDTKKMKET